MSKLLLSDLPKNKEDVLWKDPVNMNQVTIFFILGMFGLVLATISATNSDPQNISSHTFPIIFGSIIFGTIGLIYLAVLWAKSRKKKRRNFESGFGKFLQSNEFALEHNVDAAADRTHFVSGLGERNATFLPFSGQLSGTPFVTYIYAYYKRRKNGEDEHPYTVLRFSLNKPMPHIVLDSRKNDGIISGIPRFFSDDQRIELEGNFNSYFDLFAPRDYEIETLDILSPDFMQMLMDFHSDFDIEINKTEVYIISKGVNYDQQSMAELFRAAEVLVEKFNHKLKVWSMAAMAKNLPELDSHIDESAIRFGNKRISTAVFTIPLLSLYIAARMMEAGLNGTVFVVVFGISLTVLIVLRRNKRERN